MGQIGKNPFDLTLTYESTYLAPSNLLGKF